MRRRTREPRRPHAAAAAKPSTSAPDLPRFRKYVACRVAMLAGTAVRPRRCDTNLICCPFLPASRNGSAAHGRDDVCSLCIRGRRRQGFPQSSTKTDGSPLSACMCQRITRQVLQTVSKERLGRPALVLAFDRRIEHVLRVPAGCLCGRQDDPVRRRRKLSRKGGGSSAPATASSLAGVAVTNCPGTGPARSLTPLRRCGGVRCRAMPAMMGACRTPRLPPKASVSPSCWLFCRWALTWA